MGRQSTQRKGPPTPILHESEYLFVRIFAEKGHLLYVMPGTRRGAATHSSDAPHLALTTIDTENQPDTCANRSTSLPEAAGTRHGRSQATCASSHH